MARMGTPPGSVCRVYRECSPKWAWSHRMLLQVSLSPLSIWLQVWDSARQASLRQSPKTSQQASCSPELSCVWALACPALSSDVRTACESWTEADLRTKDVVKTGGSHLTILINGQTEPEVSCHVGHVGPADPCSTRISFKISSFEILDELYVALPKVPVRGCCDWKVRAIWDCSSKMGYVCWLRRRCQRGGGWWRQIVPYEARPFADLDWFSFAWINT